MLGDALQMMGVEGLAYTWVDVEAYKRVAGTASVVDVEADIDCGSCGDETEGDAEVLHVDWLLY
jgi:hypothetical protein